MQRQFREMVLVSIQDCYEIMASIQDLHATGVQLVAKPVGSGRIGVYVVPSQLVHHRYAGFGWIGCWRRNIVYCPGT